MSTRLAPPSAPPPTATPAPAPARPPRPAPLARGTRRPLPPEIALFLVSVAAAGGLARLFSGAAFLGPVLVVVAAAHGLALVLRRLGVGTVLAVALSGLGLLITVSWVVEPHTLTLGLPLAPTWHAIAADLQAAATRFAEVRAPTPATRGFVLTCAIASWVAAFAADTFAFRARTRFEALAPSFVLFLFGALLGADRFRLPATGFYLAAVLGFVVLADASRRSAPSWFAGRSGDGERALVRSGLATALVAVLVALLLGPRVPGAHDLGALGWRKGAERGSGSRVTVSPLVDIRSRLVDQSGVELFSVASPVGTYWRLTSLERFDGTIWSSVGSYAPAHGRLPSGVQTRSPEQSVVQQFDIKALSAIWLPAAYQPRRLDGVKGVRFDSDSSSLLTDTDTSDYLQYSVESALPRLDAGQLQTATLSAGQAQRYVALPPGFPSRVRQLAQQLTRATPSACAALGCSSAESSSSQLTPFHQARALQDWFRANFTYDLNVAPGHDQSAIERFLFTTRRGYCEQFAGSFAAMARSLGLPARVAVGFTPGSQGADGRWHVTDREAHAWPEVHLAPFGWVAFEPTPTRSLPGSEAYTGVGGAQSSSGGGPAATTATTTPTSVAAAPQGATDTTAPPRSSAAAATTGKGSRRSVPAPLALAVGAALLYLVGVPLAHRLRRSRRRSQATSSTSRVMLAWSDAEDELALAGLRRRPSETAPEYAVRAGDITGAGPATSELATCVTSAAFSPTGADDATAARAEAAAAAIRVEVGKDVNPARRAARYLDPRPLWELACRAIRA